LAALEVFWLRRLKDWERRLGNIFGFKNSPQSIAQPH